MKTKDLLLLVALLFVANNWGTFALASNIDWDELQKAATAGGSNVGALLVWALLNRKQEN